MAQHPGGTVENASRSAEELSITNEGLHFTVGNCENAKTHGTPYRMQSLSIIQALGSTCPAPFQSRRRTNAFDPYEFLQWRQA